MWPQQTDTLEITTWYHWRRTLNLRKEEIQHKRRTNVEKKWREWDSSGLISLAFFHFHTWYTRSRPSQQSLSSFFFFSYSLIPFIDVVTGRSFGSALRSAAWLACLYTPKESQNLRNDQRKRRTWRTEELQLSTATGEARINLIESNCCFRNRSSLSLTTRRNSLKPRRTWSLGPFLSPHLWRWSTIMQRYVVGGKLDESQNAVGNVWSTLTPMTNMMGEVERWWWE